MFFSKYLPLETKKKKRKLKTKEIVINYVRLETRTTEENAVEDKRNLQQISSFDSRSKGRKRGFKLKGYFPNIFFQKSEQTKKLELKYLYHISCSRNKKRINLNQKQMEYLLNIVFQKQKQKKNGIEKGEIFTEYLLLEKKQKRKIKLKIKNIFHLISTFKNRNKRRKLNLIIKTFLPIIFFQKKNWKQIKNRITKRKKSN